MFVETVKTEGLAHLSYVVGDGGVAAVIDPRRDVEAYLDIAHSHGARITHIIETHRNEDFVSGAPILAERTGAKVLHGTGANDKISYAELVSDGEVIELGKVRLTVLATPGHTDDSISLAMADTEFGDDAVAVFTGDALFVGDVGRTDFYPERAEQVAGALYDSLHGKILPLGDHVLVYPAHGAGSVCGAGMADRDVSTVGYERTHNPALKEPDRDAFIRRKTGEHHDKPPYFRRMERLNSRGGGNVGAIHPRPLGAEGFAAAMKDGMVALDTRPPEAFAGAYVPGSLAIPLAMLPSYAGWYLPYERDIGLIASAYEDVDTAVRHLTRLGFDRVAAFLDSELHAWETSGRAFGRIPTVHIDEVKRRLDDEETPFTLLDVRSEGEFLSAHLPGAVHIHVGEVPERLDEIPRDVPVVTFCGSGQRALIAASALAQAGFADVGVCMGSLAACKAVGCPLEEAQAAE